MCSRFSHTFSLVRVDLLSTLQRSEFHASFLVVVYTVESRFHRDTNDLRPSGVVVSLLQPCVGSHWPNGTDTS